MRDTVSLLNEHKDSFGTFSSSILNKNDELYGISKYQRKALENGGKIYLLTLWNNQILLTWFINATGV